MKKAISTCLSLLLGGSLFLTFAGCAGTNNQSGNEIRPDVSVPNADDVTAKGIEKDDPYTWFDTDKDVLPSRELCQEIAPDMRLNDVILKLGKPQRDVGYGASLFQFDVADGTVFTVTFAADAASDFTLPSYDRLVVSSSTFDMEIPDLYFPQQTVLSKLYPWMGELKEEEISEVRYEQAFIGVAPYFNFRNISYSTDKTDIANAFELFSSSLHAISQNEGQMDGGGYVQYDFMTAKGTYSVTFSNYTVLIGGQYYRLDRNLFEFANSDVECRAFITYVDDDPYEIFTYAEESEKIGAYTGLGEFEFRVYDGLLENAPRYVLKSAGGVNLLILSADKFVIEGDENTMIYQITGDKDFSFLF